MRSEKRLGFLYPAHGAEDDYPHMAAFFSPAPQVEVVHTSIGKDAHRVDALLDTGQWRRLLPGAQELSRRGVDVALWACTSASFVYGLEGAHEQAQKLADFLGVPASSTSLAFVDALRSMGLQRVALAATYPAEVTALFAEFLQTTGIQVLATENLGIITAAEVGHLERQGVIRLVRGVRDLGAQAVLVPDTALHTAGFVEELEEAAGCAVLTANQVTFWQALRLAAAPLQPALPGLGSLFKPAAAS